MVIGFAGSLKPWHGIDTLVEALARVPEAHVEVVGHGPLDSLLDRVDGARLTRLGVRPHAEVIARMAGWDLGLAPYAPMEGFWFSPLKVLEYMAAGACPVASDQGDAAQLLGHGRRGVLVPAGDAAALAGAIDALARDRDRAQRLGDRARRWVTANRSWKVNARRVLAALEFRPARSAA
jgi:glycosyltransferase involved in cell wall biosynthesis